MTATVADHAPTICAVTNVLLVGDYPPPYGGVSTQIAELQRRLSGAPGYTCRVLDIGASRRLRRPECLPTRNALEFAGRLLGDVVGGGIVHLHTNGHNVKSWLVCLACACMGLLGGRRTVVSIGSGAAPAFVGAARGPTRILIRAALGLMGVVICRNESMRRVLMALGVRPEKITILPGFYGVSRDVLPEIPAEIAAFLQRHAPVVVALAERGPEYGISLLLEAAAHLRSRYPDFGVVLIGRGSTDLPGGIGYVLRVGELPHELVLSVMRKGNVFVRPTLYDGDASSVREALVLGVPVVASDTDFRPEGVVLFRRGDVDDLVNALTRALQGPPGLPHRGGAEGEAFDRLLAIYERLAPVGRQTA